MRADIVLLPFADDMTMDAPGRFLPPSLLFPGLFQAVQGSGMFPDGKTFADAAPIRPVPEILADWERQRQEPGFDLRHFVASRFVIPVPETRPFASLAGRSLCAHIDALWPVLERNARAPIPGCSLIPLERISVVPGGRFDEIYYWDSYFTLIGLLRSGEFSIARGMVDTISDLILRHGHMPNGNRTYYLTRSQPPVFAWMVRLMVDARLAEGPEAYLPALEREYAFWMDGAGRIDPGHAHRRAVRLGDGSVLNRCWDDSDSPRDEAWLADLETAAETDRPDGEVWRDLRAACESGWDFSSRWLEEPGRLSSIRTTRILPVDINCMLLDLERTLAEALARAGRDSDAQGMHTAAQSRLVAIETHLWDEARGHYGDRLIDGPMTGVVSAAMLFPLFVGIASPDRARCVADAVRTHLLQPGGVLTSVNRSGQQWDAPNGWAPMQWIAIEGFNRCGEPALADTIARRWLGKVRQVYEATGKLTEKYDITGDKLSAGGGEYPNQDGFGWTNGVTRELIWRYEEA